MSFSEIETMAACNFEFLTSLFVIIRLNLGEPTLRELHHQITIQFALRKIPPKKKKKIFRGAPVFLPPGPLFCLPMSTNIMYLPYSGSSSKYLEDSSYFQIYKKYKNEYMHKSLFSVKLKYKICQLCNHLDIPFLSLKWFEASN